MRIGLRGREWASSFPRLVHLSETVETVVRMLRELAYPIILDVAELTRVQSSHFFVHAIWCGIGGGSLWVGRTNLSIIVSQPIVVSLYIGNNRTGNVIVLAGSNLQYLSQ